MRGRELYSWLGAVGKDLGTTLSGCSREKGYGYGWKGLGDEHLRLYEL